MKQFKMRCSAIGQIMGKTGINKTGQSYCLRWMKEQIYNRKYEFASKYTERGNLSEDESIDFIAEMLDYGFLVKNEEFRENDFVTGTPDVIYGDLIIDVKNSWDCFTFPLFDKSILNMDYYWQLQGYMWLFAKPNAKLIYTLMDTPLHLIEKEAYYWCKNNGYEELDADVYHLFVEKMTYNNVEKNNRIKVFDIIRNDDDIQKIKDRIIECRNFINSVKS